MQDSQQNTFTSAQCLTQLAVLVDYDAPMEELQKTVGGADEEERAVLAKVLERTELLDTQGAPRPGAFYILGALGTAEQAAYILRCTLWHLEHEKFSTALSSFTAGARERPDEWVLGFSSNPLTINYWDAIHPILRERGLKNTSVSALPGFRESIPVVTGESSRGQKDVLEFFARNPELPEHDFWELFWVDGLLYETYGHGRGDTVALVRLLTSHYAGFRDRVLDECLAAMRRDFRETRIFWVLYRGLEPTTAENLRRLPQLLAVLEAPQSALISFALDTLAGTVPAMNTEQAASLVDASHAVLYRTEKKVLRAQLRVLRKVVKTHPEFTQQVSGIMAEAVEALPLDLQDTARKLMTSDDTVPPEPTGRTVSIPDIIPQDRAPGENLTPLPPIDNEAEFLDVLFGQLEGEEHGKNLQRLLVYLHEHPRVELDAATRKRIHTHNRARTPDAPSAQALYLSYLVLKHHLNQNVLQPGTFPGYRENTYASPYGVLHRQLVALDTGAEAPLPPVPLPSVERIWERNVGKSYGTPQGWYELCYEGLGREFITWNAVGETEEDADLPLEQAALLTPANIRLAVSDRAQDALSNPQHRAVVQWYAWLIQNNPDILAAHYMPLAIAASLYKKSYGLDTVLGALAESWRVLTEPSHSLLAIACNAAGPDNRAAAAETLACLADRGMLDTNAYAAELRRLLERNNLKAPRIAQTLADAASISPLAGWRTLQVLVEVLPVVGSVNRGGVLVQLLVQLAKEYGVSVTIPDELLPKMKGSTVLAKNLRVLHKLTEHPSDLAAQAAEQAQQVAAGNAC